MFMYILALFCLYVNMLRTFHYNFLEYKHDGCQDIFCYIFQSIYMNFKILLERIVYIFSYNPPFTCKYFSLFRSS